ncbi:MAG: MarR family transcriptional regulator [Alicyclobacillus sp.]|nr:MarR family transcriptional regulator [Alicyclobacillus sp.]
MTNATYELLLSFREVHQALLTAVRRSAEAAGLTSLQAILLWKLGQASRLNVKELAEHLHTSSSAVSITVEQLVQLGWIDRTRSGADRRQVELQVTSQGRRVLQAVFGEETWIGRCVEQLAAWPEEELTSLLNAHRRILSIFEAKEGNPS